MQETGDRRQDAGIRKTENGKRKTNERKTIVIKLKNHNSAPDHRTDSPSQRGPGGVVTELVECVGCSFLIPHSSFSVGVLAVMDVKTK
jgi:hypothetical protein